VHRDVVAQINRYRDLGAVRIDHHLTLGELVAAYRSARVFVVASEHESFCMPLLEALSCGVPAVARDLPALRETGGPGTRFVAGNDAECWVAALDAFLAGGDTYRRGRAAGLEHAARFDWHRTATGLRDVALEGLLA
jgi:glycosyltransferase involved in cell wall biosynthesis